jgi:lipoprotein-releasing system permease protein
MNSVLVWQIAIRYLRGKRSANAVPILSRISMVAIAVGSCAMIILLSVFNGFELLINDLYKAFYPEIKITAARGKFFEETPNISQAIKTTNGIATTTRVIEDNVLINSEDNQFIATLKGIDTKYDRVNNYKQYVTEGRDTVAALPEPTTVLGIQLMAQLRLDPDNVFSEVVLYYPDAAVNAATNPEGAFRSQKLRADGAFQAQDDFDSKYMLAALPVVQQLFNAENKYSSIELKLEEGADAEDVKHTLQTKLGNTCKVETQFEQNKTMYLVMRSEKWAIYGILLLVLLIASFNMVGALSLLVMEKQKDMAILKAMGAERGTIRRIFMAEGVLWAMLGGMIGLGTGLLICWGQIQFNWISLPGSYIIDAFPVHIQLMDVLLIIATIVLIGIIASWYPALRSTRIEAPSLRSN